MTDEVRNASREHNRILRKMHKEHQKEIAQLERGQTKEIKFLQENHNERIQDIKADHIVTLDDTTRENNKEILEMHSLKEKRIQEMRDQVAKEHDINEQKLEYLRESNQDQRFDEQAKHSTLVTRDRERFQREREEEKFRAKINNSRYRAQKSRERDQLIEQKQREIGEVKDRFSRDYDKLTRSLENRMNIMNEKQESEIKKLKQDNLDEKRYTIDKGQKNLSNLNTNFQKEYEKNEQVNMAKTKDRQHEFERRFNMMDRTEYERLTQLQKRADFQKNLVRKDLSVYQEHYTDKANDPFYRMQQLDPVVFEQEESFTVEIPVPEHEKDFYLLAGSGRTLRLTFNRDYQDEFLDKDGSVLKSKKYESAVKTIPLSSPIDRKGITKTYRDGMVRFTIQKA